MKKKQITEGPVFLISAGRVLNKLLRPSSVYW